MNSCILMATIIGTPEMRYTQQNQTPFCQFLVEFQGGKDDAPLSKLKCVAWGNLATEAQATYSVGDRVVLDGSLAMKTSDRPEGFKEKVAELNVYRIHSLGAIAPASAPKQQVPTARPSQVGGDEDWDAIVVMDEIEWERQKNADIASNRPAKKVQPKPVPVENDFEDEGICLDEIPF